MIKTTLYLPEDLKDEIKRAAAEKGSSEAELIRETLRSGLAGRTRPKPQTGIFDSGDPYLAEKVDELLKGFGNT
jgi:plasmid stability protein